MVKLHDLCCKMMLKINVNICQEKIVPSNSWHINLILWLYATCEVHSNVLKVDCIENGDKTVI